MIALLIGISFSGLIIVVDRQSVIDVFIVFFLLKLFYNSFMITGTLVKILGIVLLIVVAVVLILGIGTLFKGGETSKKYSNKLMQLRVLLQFIAIVVLVSFAYFFKD